MDNNYLCDMTIKQYVESNGYKVSDLTPDELKQAEEELKIINDGGVVLDGVFSEIGYRK